MNWEIFWSVLAAVSVVAIVALRIISLLMRKQVWDVGSLLHKALADYAVYARAYENFEADREKAEAEYNTSIIGSRASLESLAALHTAEIKRAEARETFTGEDRLDAWIRRRQDELDKVQERLAKISEENDK